MSSAGTPLRLAILAPIRSMRIGLAAMLAGESELIVTQEAGDLEELAQSSVQYDVLLIAGLPLARLNLEGPVHWNQEPPALVLMLDEPLPATLPAWFYQHPWSAIPVDSGPAELATAVRAAAQGYWMADPVLAANLLQPPPGAPGPGAGSSLDPLSVREIEVLQYLSQGLANKQIAAALHLSENTIKFHISAIYAKLGAGNRAEAVRLGARLGYITI